MKVFLKVLFMCLAIFALGLGVGFWWGTMKSVRAYTETLADGIRSGGMVFGEKFYRITEAGKEAENV